MLDALARADLAVPLCVMTYYNIVFRAGLRRFARSLADAGVAGAIIPDLPLEESERVVRRGRRRRGGHRAARRTVHAPGAGPRHLRARPGLRLRRRGHGGDRRADRPGRDGRATWPRMVRAVTDRPVCIGIGVSTPDQAAEACADADGVVVGSAIVRRLLDGDGPEGAGAFVASLRAGIDDAAP